MGVGVGVRGWGWVGVRGLIRSWGWGGLTCVTMSSSDISPSSRIA